MIKLVVAILVAALAVWPMAALAQAGGSPNNAVGIWGVNAAGQPCIIAPVAGTGTPTCWFPSEPPAGGVVGVTSNNNSGTVATGGTFQTLLAPNPARKGCLIQNPTTATEPLLVSVGIATGSASAAKSYSLAPGGTFSCNNGSIVITDNIAVSATTSAHAFTETDQ